MMGGTFKTQDKVIPGTYENFIVSNGVITEAGERGVCALITDMNWIYYGVGNKVVALTKDEFYKNAFARELGYSYDAEELQAVREVFCHANKLYLVPLNNSNKAASCTYATSIFAGERSNDLLLVIKKNIDDTSQFDVKLYLGTKLLDAQTVAKASDLKGNGYVNWKTDAVLAETAGMAFTDGSNGDVTVETHKQALTLLEASGYTFNAIGVAHNLMKDKAYSSGFDYVTTCTNILTSFVQEKREKSADKFQLVYEYAGQDNEGIIGVMDPDYIPWVLGATSSCPLSQSLTNTVYDGELPWNPPVPYSIEQYESFLAEGYFMFHRVGNDVRVLRDISTLVTTSDEKGPLLKDNRTVRVIDYIAAKDAEEFSNTYMGKVPNNEAGRASLWNSLAKIRQKLQEQGVIEDFDAKDVKVSQGEQRNGIVIESAIRLSGVMEILYITTNVQ
jgi:hypothetical protein